MVLTERDEKIIKEVARWRGCLGRQIERIGNFSGTRATDRRLKKLVDEGLLTRKKYIYGLAGIYQVTKKAQKLFGLDTYLGTVRLDQAMHDMAVVDVYLYLKERLSLPAEVFTSEKEIRHKEGFTTRSHAPDFLYELLDKKGQVFCVEVELSQKAKERLESNVADNFIKYAGQKWFVPKSNKRVIAWLNEFKETYPNIEIIDLGAIE
ncbi:MAG: replication-relaxation family protein [Oscillospiraceae bacterium]|nr:replication-relaxation family protein [Oscillospiraceae bacterium]